MDKKATSIIAYITIVGWFIAYFIGDRENAKLHLNQGLILGLIGLVCGGIGFVPILGGIIGGVLGLVCLVCIIVEIVYILQDQDFELPVIGQIRILN